MATSRSLAREVALTGVMAGLANALAFIALPGPLNIQFGLTAIPILLVGFALGWRWGAVCGLVGGIMQAQKYGNILYVFYTAIQGCVAGFFAWRPQATRKLAPVFAFFGGFFLLWWVDVLRGSNFTLQTLGGTSFTDAPKVFGATIDVALPVASAVAAIILVCIVVFFARHELVAAGPVNLALAGSFGAVAYIPYDFVLLYWVQGYPWLPTWFVLSKDLAQDLLAAILCALLLKNARIHNLLYSGSPAE